MLSIRDLPMPKKATEFKLPDDLSVDQWIVPKGTTVHTQETKNFGWVFLPVDCQDKRGFTIPNRVFRY